MRRQKIITNPREFDGGLLMGWPLGSDKPLRVTAETNVMVMGPPASLKSAGVVTPNAVNLAHWSILSMDAKGKQSREWAGYRQFSGNDLWLIDPANLSGHGSIGFNPCRAPGFRPGDGNIVTNIDMLMDTIMESKKNERDTFFFKALAQDLCAGFVQWDCHANPTKASLVRLRTFVCKPIGDIGKEVRAILKYAKTHGLTSVINKLAPYSTLGQDPVSKSVLDILATARSYLKWVDDEDLSYDLASDISLDFSEMKRRPISCFVTIPGERLDVYAPWSKAVLAAALFGLMREMAGPVPVLIILDEAAQLAFPLLERRLPLLREYGIAVMSVWQDKNQGEMALGRERFLSWLSNSSTQVIFGTTDADTADMISRRSGQRTAISYGLSNGSLSHHAISRPQLRPEDIMRLPRGVAAVTVPDHPDVILSRFRHARTIPEIASRLDWEVCSKTDPGNIDLDAAG